MKKTTRKIKFIAEAVKWFDKVNGNTYHSVKITRCRDNAVICVPFQYGYGEQYRTTALEKMKETGWIKAKNIYSYERENNYPIKWMVIHGLKRECVNNGKKDGAK